MKKALLALFTALPFTWAYSQISFIISDVPTANTTQRVDMDTMPLPNFSFGNAGANQVYDFSAFSHYKFDTVEFRTPTGTQTSTCPNADVATTNDGINFLLTNTDNGNNKLTLEGFQGQICPGQTLTAAYQTKPDVYRFPMNYQTNFGGTAALTKTVPGSQVCQSVSQVRLTINTTYTDTVDGWGKVTTPLGSYKCLRNKRKETTRTQIEAQIFPPIWSGVSDETVTTIRYTYLAKETKGSVINFNYNAAGDTLFSVTWSMIPPNAPVAEFTSTNGANGSVTFTDQSDNYPTSWAWAFGDGGTSTSQSPSHTYTANGTYNVCLIATNAGGSSTQVCHTVTISNVPVAPVANFSWTNPSGGLVNFTDLSTNTPTQWAWTFGDGGTSTQQNPSHVYTANGSYNVCLTATNTAGNDQHCASVNVTGISAANSAPVAFTDTLSLAQATSSGIFHVANNDIDPDNDNVCMTAVWGSPYVVEYIGGSCDMVIITPDSNFVGTDTAWYSICDDGTPVLCDTGIVIFTVYPNPALYPVAMDDAASFLQPNGGNTNVTANDQHPVNPACIMAIFGGGNAFAISGCNNITYTPDSLFTGNDTVWYVVCDNGHPTWCDTAKLVVTSNYNSALLPVADFTYNYVSCQGTHFYNNSSNYSSIPSWSFHDLSAIIADTTMNGDTVFYDVTAAFGTNVATCLTVTNQFGTSTSCDTVEMLCAGVHELSLSNIGLYPNPANNVIAINMTQNQDEVTRSYTAIEIYNAIGEKARVISDRNDRVVNISVADLAEGMYTATIVDAKGVRRTLGRFSVLH